MKRLRTRLAIILSVCVLTESRYIIEPELEIRPLSSSDDDTKKTLTDEHHFYSTDIKTESSNIQKIHETTEQSELALPETITSAINKNSPKTDSTERKKRQEDESSIEDSSSEEIVEDSSSDSSSSDDSDLVNFSEGEVRNKKDVTPPESKADNGKMTTPSEVITEKAPTTTIEEITSGTEQPDYMSPENDFFGIFLRFALRSGDNIQKRSVQGWLPSQDEEEEEHMQAAEQNVFRPLFAYRQQQALRRRLRTPPIF